MYKFMGLTFVFLGWAFWVLSGGSDFTPPAPKASDDRVLAIYDSQTAQNRRFKGLVVPGQEPAVAPTPAAVINTVPAQVAPEPAIVNTPDPEPETPVIEDAISLIETPEIALDIRQVSATRVNMRGGPSTSFDVLTQLNQGDAVEIIENPGTGWVKLRVQNTDQIGWIAERLLTPATN